MTNDKITTAVAAAGLPGVTAPWWPPSLDQMTKVAALVYSLLGIIWLFRQILAKPKAD